MKVSTSISLLVASATAASAQATYNSTTGKFVCAKPGAAYCVGDSLTSNIIIRCDNMGVGSPGNCNDNLSGEPPFGVGGALCWETSSTSGDAACEKNCVVYGGSGNAPGIFTLKGCTPTFTASTSTASSTSSSSSTSSGHGVTSTTVITVTGSTTTCPTTVTTSPTGTGVTTPPPAGNSTLVTSTSSTPPTNTPVGPSSSPSSVVTAGASAVSAVGSVLGLVGLLVAYVL